MRFSQCRSRTRLVAQIASADLTKAKADEALAAFQAVLVESWLRRGRQGLPASSQVKRVERATPLQAVTRTGESQDPR